MPDLGTTPIPEEVNLLQYGFVIPEKGAVQFDNLITVLRKILSLILSDQELSWLAAIFSVAAQGERHLVELEGEQVRKQIDDWLESWRTLGLLPLLVNHIRQMRPDLWREQICPLTRPRSFMPRSGYTFLGRHGNCLEALELLIDPSTRILVLSGVNGIGKSALAAEVARLCRRHGVFQDILWISFQGEKLVFADEVFTWSQFFRELDLGLGWEVNRALDFSHANEFAERCWQKLKTGNYLLCIDGLDNPRSQQELLQWMQALEDGACKVLITTTQTLPIPAKHLALGGWEPQDSIFWLRRASLHWNISVLKRATENQLRELHDLAGGIPLAVIWTAAEMSTGSSMIEPDFQHLRGISPSQLLGTIFSRSFEQLHDPAQRLLLALSVFDFPPTRTALMYSAGVSESDFDAHLEELRNLALIDYDPVLLRYSLLPITRQFSRDRLAQNDHEFDLALRKNWVNYYRELTARYGGKSRRKYEILSSDWENLWQAVQFVLNQWEICAKEHPITQEAKEWGEILVAIANALTDFCRVRGRWKERLSLCKGAAEAANELGLIEDLGKFAYTVGWIYCNWKDLKNARPWAKWAFDQLTHYGRGSGYALRLLARIERDEAGTNLSKDHPSYVQITNTLKQAKDAFVRDEDKDGLARVETDWGLLAFRCGDWKQAQKNHITALGHFTNFQDQEGIATTLINIADVDVGLGDFDHAHMNYQEAIRISRSLGFVEIIADAERGLAKALYDEFRVTYRESNLDLAEAHARSAFATFEMLNRRLQLDAVEHILANIKQSREQLSSQPFDLDKKSTSTGETMKNIRTETTPDSQEQHEQYSDFYIIVRADNSISARSAQGEASDLLRGDISKDIELTLQLIEKDQTDEKLLKTLGRKLYPVIFPEKINVLMTKTETASKGKKVRVHLAILPNDLSSLPWEFLYCEERGHFLAVDPDIVLSRYLQLPKTRHRVRKHKGPLHMLVIISDPVDQVRLDPKEWEDVINKALHPQIQNHLLTIKVVKEATIKEIKYTLLETQPDIVQFVGHGIYENGKGRLALVNEKTKKTREIDDAQFADMFLGNTSNLGLVSLATCESAKSDAQQGFLGIAPKIVQKGVPAVVAMQYSVQISTARIFIEYFYSAISHRKPVDWAVQWARNAIASEMGYANREFATPVLYMRARGGKIF